MYIYIYIHIYREREIKKKIDRKIDRYTLVTVTPFGTLAHRACWRERRRCLPSTKPWALAFSRYSFTSGLLCANHSSSYDPLTLACRACWRDASL